MTLWGWGIVGYAAVGYTGVRVSREVGYPGGRVSGEAGYLGVRVYPLDTSPKELQMCVVRILL